jgi:hypothetical protein
MFAEHFAAQRLAWRLKSRQQLHEVPLRGLTSVILSGAPDAARSAAGNVARSEGSIVSRLVPGSSRKPLACRQ